MKSVSDSEKVNDAELIVRFKRTKELHHVGVLYKRYTHLIFGLSMSYLKNKQDSQDAVMDIFEKLSTALLEHEVDNFKTWIFYVTRNHCLKKLRPSQRPSSKEVSLQEEMNFMESGEPEDHLFEQFGDLLEGAIGELKLHHGKCIRLFYLEKKSYSEIEQLTGYTNNEVKSYIQNAKRNLKIILLSKSDKQ